MGALMGDDRKPKPKEPGGDKPKGKAAAGRAGVLPTAGFLILVQLLAGLGVWFLSFSTPLKTLACVAFLGWLYLAARWPAVLAGLDGWWRRAATIALWQLPALGFGAWILVDFCGGPRVPDAGLVVVQVWAYPLTWLAAQLSPDLRLGGNGLSTWIQAAVPWLAAAGLLLASRRR